MKTMEQNDDILFSFNIKEIEKYRKNKDIHLVFNTKVIEVGINNPIEINKEIVNKIDNNNIENIVPILQNYYPEMKKDVEIYIVCKEYDCIEITDKTYAYIIYSNDLTKVKEMIRLDTLNLK